MDAGRRALEPFFADASASLERLVERSREIDSESPQFDDETNRQFVHGFASIVREALAGQSREARDLYTEAAAAVLAEQGRTPASLARSLVTFGLLLGEEVGQTVEPEARNDAVRWLAAFMGEWSEELVAAADGASRSGQA